MGTSAQVSTLRHTLIRLDLYHPSKVISKKVRKNDEKITNFYEKWLIFQIKAD
jgi:hypothetical protein